MGWVARLKLWRIYNLRRFEETFEKITKKSFPLWPLAIIAMISLIALGSFGIPALTGFFAGGSKTGDYNPASGDVAVEELPLVVKIEPENMIIKEDTWETISISLNNPKDFDITKNLTLEVRNANWDASSNTWGGFGSFGSFITLDVTVHPKDTVKLDIPVLLHANVTHDENVLESGEKLYNFRLKTAGT